MAKKKDGNETNVYYLTVFFSTQSHSELSMEGVMRATFIPKVSRNTELTMNITATLEEWEELVKKMPASWPSWKFADLIKTAISEIDKHFVTEQKVSD